MSRFRSIQWLEGGIVRILDQRRLPQVVVYNDYANYHDVAKAIKDMAIRGAPAIGAAAAYGLALAAYHSPASEADLLREEISNAATLLRHSRPTAVNLSWALDRMLTRLAASSVNTILAIQETALAEAQNIAAEDVQLNKRIGLNGLTLIPDKATIIHHCNTGSLATVDYGTALGIIRMAHEHGKDILVLLDETRPRLQGARLSAWELKEYGVPFKVIVDSASGHYMRTKGVDLCVVGADRIAANGDTANKIGTYNLAVVASENNVPFYVAAPTTTLDINTPTGEDILIEERPGKEISHIGDYQITPDSVEIGNPAFDVTPAKYITAIITEQGVIYPPFPETLEALMG